MYYSLQSEGEKLKFTKITDQASHSTGIQALAASSQVLSLS